VSVEVMPLFDGIKEDAVSGPRGKHNVELLKQVLQEVKIMSSRQTSGGGGAGATSTRRSGGRRPASRLGAQSRRTSSA